MKKTIKFILTMGLCVSMFAVNITMAFADEVNVMTTIPSNVEELSPELQAYYNALAAMSPEEIANVLNALNEQAQAIAKEQEQAKKEAELTKNLNTAVNATTSEVNPWARSEILGDANTGEIIYNLNGFEKLMPASTTKILTTLLVVEAIERGQINLDTEVEITKNMLARIPYDASTIKPKFKVGEKINVFGLLLADMVSSDCAACDILGEVVSGSVPEFVKLMNQRAAQLGCIDSNFTEPSGYPRDNHYTNAYSLFLITREALKHEMFRNLMGCRQIVIPPTNKTGERNITNTNKLLSNSIYFNPYCIGGKTGTSNDAGECLVSVGAKDGKTVIAVVLGTKTVSAPDGTKVEPRYTESNRLLKMGLGY